MLRTCTSLYSARQLRQAALHPWSIQQVRSFNIWDLFSKDKLQDRREKLNDELRRGYFSDLKDLEKDGGKPFAASTELVPAHAARAVPSMGLVGPDGARVDLEQAVAGQAASLLVVIFRANAQPMSDSWTEAFAGAFSARPSVGVVRLLVVESFALGLMRSLILRGDGRPRAGAPLFLFGGPSATYDVRLGLGITNRLTAYTYLLDSRQRVRWQATGAATEVELGSLLQCTEQLLREEERGSAGAGGRGSVPRR